MINLKLFLVLSLVMAGSLIGLLVIPAQGLSHDNKTKTGLDHPAMPMGDRTQGVNNSLLTINNSATS